MNEVVENGIKSITVTGGNAELYTTIVLQPPSLPTDESTTPPSPPTDESTIPPAPTPLSKIIVIAKLEREDTSWVGENLPDWQNAIYTVDNINASLHTSVNKGREANAYLTYLVNSYDELPDIIAFIHSHRKGYPGGWHTDAMDYDNVISLQTLNINFVQRQGYTNLRCIAVPGCPDEVQPFRNPPEAYRKHEHAFPAAWKYMFVDKDIPSVVGTPCCSQFAVSKEQVLARPRSDYM
ncbi:hypothetical protein MMC06_006388, partial [Schaereria dolodes]|nr:hypothetical protein [Schaereria dolodes]